MRSGAPLPRARIALRGFEKRSTKTSNFLRRSARTTLTCSIISGFVKSYPMISSRYGFPSRRVTDFLSPRYAIYASGKVSLSACITGVVRTMSPMNFIREMQMRRIGLFSLKVLAPRNPILDFRNRRRRRHAIQSLPEMRTGLLVLLYVKIRFAEKLFLPGIQKHTCEANGSKLVDCAAILFRSDKNFRFQILYEGTRTIVPKSIEHANRQRVDDRTRENAADDRFQSPVSEDHQADFRRFIQPVGEIISQELRID